MIKKLAWLFAAVFVIVGILGFVPGITTDGHLLGIFEVDTVHNLVHLLTGILFGIAAMMGSKASSNFFKVFGIIYLIVAIWGFFGGSVLWFLETNRADDWLHLVLGIVILAIAFGVKPEEDHAMAMDHQMGGGDSSSDAGGTPAA